MMIKIKNYIKLIRVKHYIKNLLIFIPLLFSGQLLDVDKLINCLCGFILFSMLASSVYIFNDLKDVEKDKAHPTKKNRPIASGNISSKEAIVLMVLLLFLIMLISIIILRLDWITNQQFITLLVYLGIYFIVNILYSLGLKNIPILDVVIIVIGFLIRVLFGAAIASINISNWLYLTIMAGAFYLGFGKRRNETMIQGDKSRDVLKKYNKEFLDKFMYVCLILAIVFYSLWCIDATTIERVGNNYMIWTIPLLLILTMKYSLNIEGDSFGDPVDVILNDRVLIVLVFLLAISMIGILYVL